MIFFKFYNQSCDGSSAVVNRSIEEVSCNKQILGGVANTTNENENDGDDQGNVDEGGDDGDNAENDNDKGGDGDDQGNGDKPNIRDSEVCKAEEEDNPGNEIQRDIDKGKSLTIKCSSGCLKITKAMFSCVADSGVMVPGQADLLKSKCDGRSECLAPACDGFWGTNLKCASFDKAQMWVHFRCDGDDATVTDEIQDITCDKILGGNVNDTYDDHEDGDDQGDGDKPDIRDSKVCKTEEEEYPGNNIQRDIDKGKSITIQCSSGCLRINKAMYSCVADAGVMVPGQMELLQSKCDGKSECYAEACDSFWGTKLKCASFDKEQLWVHYR